MKHPAAGTEEGRGGRLLRSQLLHRISTKRTNYCHCSKKYLLMLKNVRSKGTEIRKIVSSSKTSAKERGNKFPAKLIQSCLKSPG
jgi:hypothetical protein